MSPFSPPWSQLTFLDYGPAVQPVAGLLVQVKWKPVHCATVAHLKYIGYYGNMDPMENDPIL